MPLQIRFIHLAKRDLREILHYEEHAAGRITSFQMDLKARLQFVSENPKATTLIRGDIRKISLNHFPFAVYYRLTQDSIKVITIVHHSRHPRIWQRRIR